MKKRVMILEDELRSQQGLTALLRSDGHEVLVARHALEAQVLCAEFKPDLAVVDIHLPGLSGDAWAAHLKKASPATRIVFVSGQAGISGLERFGPDTVFLKKPICPEEFLDVVSEGRSVVARD